MKLYRYMWLVDSSADDHLVLLEIRIAYYVQYECEYLLLQLFSARIDLSAIYLNHANNTKKRRRHIQRQRISSSSLTVASAVEGAGCC